MQTRIAAILRDRISAFTFVDKLAGMVRPISYRREGKTIVVPVASDAIDALACDESTQRDMVPDAAYACIVYFEDRVRTTERSRTRGTKYLVRLRLVCWMNIEKFAGDPLAPDRVQAVFEDALRSSPYNMVPFVGVKHWVEGSPERGSGIFGKYSYDEATRQYLLAPFDAFAIDVVTELRVMRGCEDQVTVGDDACWTPPTTSRRRHPSEFTCEELTAPGTGLTAEQLGPGCLDCGGGGPCDPITVNINGVEVASPDCGDTVNLPVLQGGLPVGGWNGTEWVIEECPECPECAPLGYDLHNSVDTVILAGIILEPCGQTLELLAPDGEVYTTDGLTLVLSVPSAGSEPLPQSIIRYEDVAGAEQDLAPVATMFDGVHLYPLDTVRRRELKDSAANGLGLYATLDGLVDNTIPACPDGSVQLEDSAAAPIGSPVAVRSGQTAVAVTAPDGSVTITDSTPTTLYTKVVKSNGTASQVITDGSVQLKDSAGANIGSAAAIKAQGSLNVTAPDATAVVRNSVPTTLSTTAIKSNASLNIAVGDSTITKPDGTTIGLPAEVALDMRLYIPLSFGLQATHDRNVLWTITAEDAGTYASLTQDGASGTITYKKNGGTATSSMPVTFVATDTVQVIRTSYAAIGFIKMNR